MPRPTFYDQAHFLTTLQVARAVGVSQDTLVRRIAAGMYPPPLMVKENGLRLFNQKWVEKVLAQNSQRGG
jgi:predicted DNA-binding transcriptional regulator AlpA